MIVPYLIVEKIILIQSQVGIFIPTSQDVLHRVSEMKHFCFFLGFGPQSLTFATDPRVVESVIGSAPVE